MQARHRELKTGLIRRCGWPVVRKLASLSQIGRDVAIRESAAGSELFDAKQERHHGRLEGIARNREAHTGHRQNLPAGRGPRSDTLSARGARSRKNRHHPIGAGAADGGSYVFISTHFILEGIRRRYHRGKSRGST